MGKYFKNNFYPQNFILLTTAENKYQAVDEIVNEVKQSEEWEAVKMNILEIGIEKGKKDGNEEGMDRVNRLNRLLAEQNRTDDIIKAAGDKKYQEKLFKEFHL